MHLLQDKIDPTKVYRRDEVPTSVDALTESWWTSCLRSSVVDAAVMGVERMGGDSGTHARHRFRLEWNEAGQWAQRPEAVFTKTLPTLMNRMIGGFNGTAKAEGRFYMEIRPHLEIESPIGYHAGFDAETFAAINVLEDVGVSRQATFCNATTHVDRPMAEGMVELLADLHGSTMGDHRLTEEWRWVVNFADWFAGGAKKMRTEKYTYQALRRARHILPDSLVSSRKDIWRATEASAQIHRDKQFLCLLHSDVHIGNWYQTGSGEMGLLDWQCLTQGHYARDLAYALSAALKPEDRQAWEHQLVQTYLLRLGNYDVTVPAFDEAWKAYRTQLLHAFWMWTITLCHSPLLPAMQTKATSLEMVRRIGIAIDDHRSIDVALGR